MTAGSITPEAYPSDVSDSLCSASPDFFGIGTLLMQSIIKIPLSQIPLLQKESDDCEQ